MVFWWRIKICFKLLLKKKKVREKGDRCVESKPNDNYNNIINDQCLQLFTIFIHIILMAFFILLMKD